MLGKRSDELIIRLRVVGNTVELVNLDEQLQNPGEDKTARVPQESLKALKIRRPFPHAGDRTKPKEDRTPRQPPNIAPEDASKPGLTQARSCGKLRKS